MACLRVLDEQVEVWMVRGGPDTGHIGVLAEHLVDKVTCKSPSPHGDSASLAVPHVAEAPMIDT
jgi:hypothetical protein